jgi:hypothetical protein
MLDSTHSQLVAIPLPVAADIAMDFIYSVDNSRYA